MIKICDPFDVEMGSEFSDFIMISKEFRINLTQLNLPRRKDLKSMKQDYAPVNTYYERELNLFLKEQVQDMKSFYPVNQKMKKYAKNSNFCYYLKYRLVDPVSRKKIIYICINQ